MCQALFEVLVILLTHEPSVLTGWINSKHRRKYVTVLGSGRGYEQVKRCDGWSESRVDGKHLGRLLGSILCLNKGQTRVGMGDHLGTQSCPCTIQGQ